MNLNRNQITGIAIVVAVAVLTLILNWSTGDNNQNSPRVTTTATSQVNISETAQNNFPASSLTPTGFPAVTLTPTNTPAPTSTTIPVVSEENDVIVSSETRIVEEEERVYLTFSDSEFRPLVGGCRLMIQRPAPLEPIFGWENDCSIVRGSGALEMKPLEFSGAFATFEAEHVVLQINREGGWANATEVDISDLLDIPWWRQDEFVPCFETKKISENNWIAQFEFFCDPNSSVVVTRVIIDNELKHDPVQVAEFGDTAYSYEIEGSKLTFTAASFQINDQSWAVVDFETAELTYQDEFPFKTPEPSE